MFTTSTSPSGRHLSLYKSMLHPEEDLEGTPISDQFYQAVATLLNLCGQQGMAFDRWKTIHTLMLEKISGLDRVDKLRVIHILEADMNLLYGIMWTRMMVNAEKHEALNMNQWGSRKNKQCIDVVLLKVFTYELSRYTRTSLITFDNDAKSCYDRIVMCFALR